MGPPTAIGEEDHDMQSAARIEYDHLQWLWAIYDAVFNRSDPARFLEAAGKCRVATFNGSRMATAGDMADAYASICPTAPKRDFKLDRTSIDFDVVIGPETFANCASLWWIVPSSPDADRRGNAIYGATQILFREHNEILEVRDLWPRCVIRVGCSRSDDDAR